MRLSLATRALVAAGSLLLAGTAFAQAQRLDDSASPRNRVAAQVVMDDNGRPLEASPFAESAQIRFGRIEYRLATAAYVGRQVRITYVVPNPIPGLRSADALRVEWRGQPPLASGSARPGDHVPVWTGRIAEAWTELALDLSARVDLRQLDLRASEPLAFECHFEIEILR